MQPVRIALVGCGQIGRLHAQRLAADGRAKITACIDPDLRAAERISNEFSAGARRVADLSLALDSADIDAVILCTPTAAHFEQVRLARGRGLPVLCEKPLAGSREKIVRLIAESAEGPLLSLAYQRRYWSAFRTLRREIRSGRWGPVRSVTVTVMERWQPTIAGTWRDDPLANPGGFLGDAGSHKLDMLFFLTGLVPVEVSAISDCRGSHVEIATTVIGKLSQDVALSMTFIGDAQHLREDFHVHCVAADLMIRDGAVWIARDNRVEQIAELEPENDPDRAFLDCLLQGAPNEAPADCALPVWDLTQMILRRASVPACSDFTAVSHL